MGEASDKFIRDCEGRIIDPVDKAAFAEVGNCYRLKLYKAGYILCWTVLAESIRQKIRQLSDMGYNPAISENTRIEKLERDHRSADVQIIDSAKTCELISDTEHTICRQLWTKRCLFAHPYGTQATKTDCRDIIEKTIDYAMARPIYLTKAMFEERLDDYIKHPHTIPDKARMKMVIESFLKLILPKHNTTLFQALFYRIRGLHESGKYGEVFSFLQQLCRTHIIDRGLDLNETAYRIDKGISDYPDTTWLVVSDKRIWLGLTDLRRENLVKYLNTGKTPKIVLYSARNLLIDKVAEPGNLETVYYSKVKKTGLSSALQLYIDKDMMLDHIWDKYISEYQFADQGTFIDFLQYNENEVAEFNGVQLHRLGNFVGFSCHTGTFRAQDFVKAHSSRWFENIDFVKGVIEECLKSRDRKKIVFSAWEYGLKALRKLRRIDKSAFEAVLLDIQNTPVDTTQSFYQYRRDELKNTLSNIFNIHTSKDVYDRLSALLS